jgi:hypothetical protein
MVREGIVLGHLISERGIEVDRAKIEVIEQLPPPVNVIEGLYNVFLILLDLLQTCLPKMFLLTLMILVLNLLKL